MMSDELVPQDDLDLEGVFAMLGAFNGGGYGGIDQMLGKRPDIVRRLQVGRPSLDVIESHLLFRNPVPMEFALARMGGRSPGEQFGAIASIQDALGV